MVSLCFCDPPITANLRPKVVEHREEVHVLPDTFNFAIFHYEFGQR